MAKERVTGHFFTTSTILNPSFRFVSCRSRDQQPNCTTWCNSPQTTSPPQAKKNKRLFPAAPILQMSVIASCHAIDHNHYDLAMWLLLIELANTIISVHMLTKGEFPLLFWWFDTTLTDPSCPAIAFLPRPPEFLSCFGMIMDEGGAAPSSSWLR